MVNWATFVLSVGNFTLKNDTLKNQVYRLVNEVNRIAQLVQSSSMESVKPRSKWVQKVSNRCLVVLNALCATKPNVWYLDSGCSHHMSGDKNAFLPLSPFNGGGVVPDLPQLKNVSYVKGLKSSLISISQLCDEVADEVCFSKKGCRIMDKHEKNILVPLDLEIIVTFLMLQRLVIPQNATIDDVNVL